MESPAPVARPAPAGLDPRRWWVLALLCGAFFMVLLDGTITIVALPSIGADLGFSKQDLPWVLSAYVLTFGGLLLLGGRAADLLAGVACSWPVPALHGRVARVRAGLVAGGAPRRPRRPGRRRRDHDPDRPVDHLHDLFRGLRAEQGAGDLGALGGIGATTAW